MLLPGSHHTAVLGNTSSNSHSLCNSVQASQVALVVKNPSANAGDVRGAGLIPRLGRSPGEGYGNSLQYSCLENHMDRGAWQATVHGVAKHWTQLKCLSTTLKVPFREGNGTPLQYSCLESPMDGRGWWATVHWVAKTRTQLK